MGIQPEKWGARKKRHGGISLSRNWSYFFIFQICLYTFCYTQGWIQSHLGVSRPDPCQNQVLHIKVYKQTWKIKKWDQFLERLIPPCHSFLLPIFLAEFPSGAWVLAMSTYLSRLSSRHEKEPKEGHLLIFKWYRWPNVDGANSLSWNFIGIPRKPSYSASFSLLLFSGRIPTWCMGTHHAC